MNEQGKWVSQSWRLSKRSSESEMVFGEGAARASFQGAKVWLMVAVKESAASMRQTGFSRADTDAGGASSYMRR
jgi:hypothetical protein